MKYSKILMSCFLLLYSCATEPPTEPNYTTSDFNVTVLKWFNGHNSAVTITYDAGWRILPILQSNVDEVLQRNLTMDFELVTIYYNNPENFYLIEDFRENLMPHGIHFFGHGHRHINYDTLSYSEAFEDFKLCFDLMKSWDLNPSVYAYPGGRGYLQSTQLANETAGFIAARGATTDPNQFYICADNANEPENWYYLPAVSTGIQDTILINNNSEMIPVLNSALQKNAWIILMYHSIGLAGGWGYYPFEEFTKDLDFIASNDFWCGNMDNVTKYIKEKNNFNIQKTYMTSNNEMSVYRVKFSDNLDNEMFNQPLSIQFETKGDLVQTIKIVYPDSTTIENAVINDLVSFNIIPDEKEYLVYLMKNQR